MKIEDFLLFNEQIVAIVTEKHSLEIYSFKSSKNKPIFRLDLRYSARLYPVDERSFFVLTSDGGVLSIDSSFQQTSSKHLGISSSKFFGTMCRIESKASLVVLADDRSSVAIWNGETFSSVKIDLSRFASLQLEKFLGEPTEDFLLFHFNDKTLLSSRLTNSKSSPLVSFGHVDRFAVESQRLVTATNDSTRLDFYSVFSSNSERTIELNGKCEHLCLNASASYVFVVVAPRLLLMYRVNDGRALGRLFLHDFVMTIAADADFLVLAMNDRRLLTLLIADPDDPQLPAKISALPSR